MAIKDNRHLPTALNQIISEEKSVLPPHIIIATRNEDKINEYSRILRKGVTGINLKIPEIQHEDPMIVLSEKAKAAWLANNCEPIIVEDVSLMCKGIENLPGPFIDQFSNTYSKREALCKMLDGKDRSAVFQVLIGLFDGKEMHFRRGIINGLIAEKPLGNNGFGFDDIFIPDKQVSKIKKTYAQMEDSEKDKYSPRKLALLELSKKPFEVKKPVYMLPEPYDIQLDHVAVSSLAKNSKALRFAYMIEQFADTTPSKTLEFKPYKPYKEFRIAKGQIKRFITDEKSASLGLILTPWDTSRDLYGNAKHIKVDISNNPVFWQMGEKGTKLAIASRAYEFSVMHSEKMHEHIRSLRDGKIRHVPRPNVPSSVIEELLEIKRKPSYYPDKAVELRIQSTAATKELGYSRMSATSKMSRTKSAESGLLLNTAGIPSSLFALGGMPPVSGWRDVLITSALSYMRSYIPRNSIFAGNVDRQMLLFRQVKEAIETLNLPLDIEKIVLSQIGIAVGCEDPQKIAMDVKRMMKLGCRLIRIYTTNPDPRTIETALAIRQMAGSDLTLCVAPIVDVKQAEMLISNDIKANILLAGHGGGENCTSLAGGGTANALEILYLMYLDSRFNNTAIGLEGGTGDEIGALLGMVDVISLNRRGVRGGIETGGLFVEHMSGKAVQPYHGSASIITQWIESAVDPDIAKRRLNQAARVKNVEGVLNYMKKQHSHHSIVEHFWNRRMFAGRALADQNALSLYELRQNIARNGYLNLRYVTADASYIAAAHKS